MTFTTSFAQAAVAVAAFGLATFARAELPDLQAKQVLGPSQSDFELEPGDARFGDDVVIKGNLAIIGIPAARAGVGRAAIHVRDATGKWIRRATLEASDSVPVTEFGKAVAISGRRAVVGSRNAVYVFENDSSGWHQRQKLFFGQPIFVSDIDFEGNFLAIGAGGSFGGSSTNGVHVFLLGADGVFRAITRTSPIDVQPGDQFGWALALSGTTLAVTAPRQNTGQGAAYLFACTNTGCVRKQKLIANDGDAGDQFGSSVDVLNNTLVIGAQGADPVFADPNQGPSETNFTAQGAAYVYVRSTSTGNEWTEQQKLRITPDEYDEYLNLGLSVALSANRIVVGAPYGNTAVVPGKMFVFALSGGMYTATHKVIGPLGLGDSVSISGTQLLSGAPLESLNRGQAYVYALP